MANECLKTWQKLVVITGGDIELDKSSLNIMACVKRKGKEIMIDSDEIEDNLLIRSVKFTGYSEAVDRLSNDHGERTLGVRLAVDGSDTTEFKFRNTQVKELAYKKQFIEKDG